MTDEFKKRAISVREFAEALHLDPKTVYSAAQRGEIPTILIGRRVLIPMRWLERKLSGGAAQPAASHNANVTYKVGLGYDQ